MLATVTITILISGMCSEIVLRCCEALSMRGLAYCISTSQPILCDCESGCRTLAIRQKRYQVVLKPAQRLSSRSRSGPAPGLVLLQVWSQKSVFFILVCSAATREFLPTPGHTLGQGVVLFSSVCYYRGQSVTHSKTPVPV